MSFLEGLNENQELAVMTTARYVRVIAGAGSGKTRVLTTRIAHLMQDLGVFSGQILAITFTNKAANEMKERILSMLGPTASAMHISTIHSLCVRILREDIHSMNYPKNFTVVDAEDQKTILKEAYKELGIEKQKVSYASMLDYIANNKAAYISVERAYELAGDFFGEKDKARVYEYYDKRLKGMYALDFDDLLLVTVKMFDLFEDILAKWQKRFRYIHVDEFQDIDHVQYKLIQQLAGSENEIYVVGDPDQTIYTWRGADVNIIMNFDKDYPTCETVILNENYRSQPKILEGANSIIQYNKNRVEKELFTRKEPGDNITHFSGNSEEYEALWVANKIVDLKSKGNDYKSIAILYRSNYLSRSIEKGLLDSRIPYVIYGGVRFYDRLEVKDSLSYLRMLASADDLAFTRIINSPRRGIGNKTIDIIRGEALRNNTTMYEVIKAKRDFGGKVQKALDEFVAMIEQLANDKEKHSIDKLLELLLDQSGYRKMWEDNNETDRLENIKELINDIQQFMATYPEGNLDEYLQLVSLYGDHEEYKTGSHVQLMTIHAAKGLEFDNVFVVGMSDGVFPSERSMQEGRKGLEEERRLAYVAYTRARKRLFLSETTGYSYVLNKIRTRSRFIDEVAPEYIEHIGANFEYTTMKEYQLSDALFGRAESFEEKVDRVKKRKLKNGMIILHTTYGEGVILSVTEGIAEIAFSFPHGVKKIMADHPSIQLSEELS